MALSVFFSVFPLLFAKKRLWIYGVLSFFCQLFMCETYQASSGIYPMLVLLLCFLAWNRKEETKAIGKFLLVSVIAYVTALGLFEVLCYQFSDPEGVSYVDASITVDLDFFQKVFQNYKTYYELVQADFRNVWKILIGIMILFFFFVVVRETKQKKWRSLFCAIFFFGFLLLFPFGIYPALSDPIFAPRAMYGIGALLAMLGVVIANAASKFLNLVGKLSCAALGFCFIIFSNVYGNVLQIQQDYTDLRTQAIIDDLIELDFSDAEEKLYFQLDYGVESWESPILRNNSAYNISVIHRMLRISYPNKRFLQIRYSSYYDFNFIYDDSIDLSTYNLPILVDNAYHTIYGNDEYIYVVMK